MISLKAASVLVLLALGSGCAGTAPREAETLATADAIATDEPTKEALPETTKAKADAALEVEITMLEDAAPLRVTRQLERKQEPDRVFGTDAGLERAEGEAAGPRVDAASIKQAVSARNDLFGRCLSSDASVAIDAMIGPSGNVLQVSSSRSVPDEPKLRDCVVEGFKQLKFPALESSDPARIRFDLALKRPLSY